MRPALVLGFVIASALLAPASSDAHTLHRASSRMPAVELERVVASNLAHSRGAVRRLEAFVGPLGPNARRQLRWHRAAAGWQARTLHRLRAARLERMTWLEAVALVDRHLGYGAWLRSCSAPRSEGGHGRWFWNGGYPVDESARRRALHGVEPGRPAGSSGAGGWLQFLRSTFDSVIAGGVVRARRHGLEVPPIARSWFHPLGQAVAGVEMLERGRRGEWAGYGC